MKLRWLLPPLALACLAGGLWIRSHGRQISAPALLASARARLAAQPRDPAGALHELDEALRMTHASAPGDENEELRADVLRERSLLYWAQGLPELALDDCRALLAEAGPDVETLTRANELCLWLGDSGSALDFANQVSALDPAKGRARVGRCRVALADRPLAEIERRAREALPQESALTAVRLAQRAAVFAAEPGVSAAALDEMLELFTRPEDRRALSEWVREASEHLEAARQAFVESLAPGTTMDAVAGLQDLLLRGGAESSAADLGQVALALPDLRDPMPVLARTASALQHLGRSDTARALIGRLRARNPAALRPQALPSNDLRDELEEWCLLVEQLGLWDELRAGALELEARGALRRDQERRELARFFIGLADLRANRLGPAQMSFEALGTRTLDRNDVPVRSWLAQAEIARRKKQPAQEHYALIRATKEAPLDPLPPLRAPLGRAWLRLHEIQKEDGELLQAEVSLTHALRCSPEVAGDIEPLWHELGRSSLAARGASSPYMLFSRARNELERGQYAPALEDAHLLLKSYPGLGPALEIVSKASNRLRDYPITIESSLEMLARGWPGQDASARLRAIPSAYFLPQDRVRWLELDPRGSLESVLACLTARGDHLGAALAARSGPAKFQPPELLPLCARVEFEAGFVPSAEETLELLPGDEPAFRGATGLVLRVALAQTLKSNDPRALERALAKVCATRAAADPELVRATDALLAAGRLAEASTLLAWLAPQDTPWLGETLLRSAVVSAALGKAGKSDDDLERAAAFFADGRADMGRMVLAAEHDDWDELAREAQLALETPLADGATRAFLLELLAGDFAAAAESAADLGPLDGRDLALELGVGLLDRLAPDARVGEDAPELPTLALAPPLVDALDPRRLALLCLGAEVAPWAAWTLARCDGLAPELRAEPAVALLRARACAALGEHEQALLILDAFASAGPDADTSEVPALAWTLRAENLRALERTSAARDAELAWLAKSGRANAEDPALAVLRADAAVRRGESEEGARILAAALEARADDPEILAALAALEDVPGRRTRAIELLDELVRKGPAAQASAAVLTLLDVLAEARDANEISVARWWSEVEALEAERPLDPAVPRALAERSFEDGRASGELGRADALERLERFRERSAGRPLEELRAGETRRWTGLLARFTPERAVHLAQAELLSNPGDPELWRASAEALLAADHWRDALSRLEALQRVAPERDTARLLALTSFAIDNDPAKFLRRLAGIEKLDPAMKDDPQLAFYRGIAALRSPGKEDRADAERGLALWQARADNGLGAPRHGMAFALALFAAGLKGPALAVLEDCIPAAESAVQGDLIKALGYLMKAAPAKQRVAAPPADAAPAGDAPPEGAPDAKSDADGAAQEPAPTESAPKAAPGKGAQPAGGAPKKPGGPKKPPGNGPKTKTRR